jgi:hypothetical protein
MEKNRFISLLLFLAVCLSIEASQCEPVFTEIWRTKGWGGVSVSGSGSDLEQTEALRAALPALLKKYHCKVLVDAPCGDFYWMKTVELPIEKYIGVDIVKPLIATNQEMFGNDFRSFIYLDITRQVLPKADIVLCRDCFVHFSYIDIVKTIKKLKQSGSTYLLTTNFTKSNHFMLNFPIETGLWRPLDLRLAPLFFPEPLEIINEHCTQGDNTWDDKSLFLWKIEDLPELW